MSNDKKVQEQELKRLEDQAYFELCQIIAEAMQYQDIELLNARIAYWKNKYKKLLDNPSLNFKKRIDYLLNQYYSEITLYISKLLALKEKKKIENQAKAMKQLYRIIKDTNDYDLLKKKITKWEEKYPIDSFLRMYQKRIEIYTRDKTIRENAFKQEEAFSDLVGITKKYATIDELKDMIKDWEKKYSINDKYTIDDFIKHQSEVKRFISDEFLQSIARDESQPDDINKVDIVEEYNNRDFSDLSIQASSYSSLLKISRSPNSINEMFKWVYKNKNIKFNDKYKELILSATYLEYSPTYLNKLNIPNIDMSTSSLTFDEYQNINDIKRYTIISYFNLLLPPRKAVSNDYFTKNIQTIYAKSEKAKTTSKIEDPSLSIDDMLSNGIEITLENSDKPTVNIHEENVPASDNGLDEITDPPKYDIQYQEPEYEKEDVIDLPEEDELDYDTIVAFSPLFIATINSLDKQATIVEHIDSDVTKHIEAEKAQEFALDTVTKTKLDTN